VSVFIQSSDGFNAFGITLLADHTILKPAGVDLTGSVLPGPRVVLVECVGGVLIQGGGCPSTDNADTLDLAAMCSTCGNTPTPTTGLLFTAIYNVTGSATGIPLGYQTGCSNSSVSGTTTCVDIANGGVASVPENVQTATFTTGDYSMTANPTVLSIHRSSQTTSMITLTSNGFGGTVTLSASISPSTGHSPSTALSASSVTLASGGTGSTVLTVSTAKNTGFGSYTVTITGTSGAITHSVIVSVTVTH
jgi:hypothetical protein